MGLLNTYGNNLNIETQQSLLITYSVEEMSDFNGWYKATRTATKYYKYVGMTYSAASQCAREKASQYTRNYSRVVIRDLGAGPLPHVITINECKTSIAAQKVSGCMYETVIQVNEYDEKCQYGIITDPAALFVSENARNYDDYMSGSLTIIGHTDTWVGNQPYITALTLDGEAIPGFPTSNPALYCTIMYYNLDQKKWIPIHYVGSVGGWSIPTPPIYAGGWSVKAKYGTYESNVILVCAGGNQQE